MAPTVSVLIPTYNRAHLINKAIDSVLAQTYQDIEIVVIDDGSTDNTKEVIGKYGRDIIYVYQENRGIAGARNTGFLHCSGKYIAFLDSDDYWLPQKLERQIALFEQHPEYGMVACQCASIDAQGHFRKKNRPGRSGWILEALFHKNFIRTSAAVVTKPCIQTIGFFDETLRECEEYDLWLRIAAQFPIGFINEPLAVYTDNPSGVSIDSLAGRLHRLRVLEKPYLQELIPPRAYRRRIADTCHYIGRHYCTRGDYREGVRYLVRAQRLAPFFLKNLFYLGRYALL
ncbi:MAG: glycosyltransferase [Desulfobacterota bacterium]|nr:glycosyltransferase [Thermodesulfobacteriota bacterium]